MYIILIYMPKYINIIRRHGNKEDDIKYFIDLLPLDAKCIVEPFGGSFAVIRKVYTDINKYNLHINDTDPDLFYIYKNFNEYIDDITSLSHKYKNDFHHGDSYYTKEFKNYVENVDINKHIKHYILNSHFIKGVMFKPLNNTNYNPVQKLILENSMITHKDYKDILEQYKDNVDAFVFLDPPYLFSDNSSYYSQNEEKDMTDIIVYIHGYLKTCKCKVMLVINKLTIIEWLFKDYIKSKYLKTYQIGKKKSLHLVITNYNVN